MSYDDKNLTTDAVPGAPRRIIPDIIQQESVNRQKQNNDKTAETEQSNKSNVEPTYSSNKKKFRDSKPKKTGPKNSNTSNIFVVNSSQVHFGAINNFNYCSEEPKRRTSDDRIPRTDEINCVLTSRAIINRDHIGLIATHLGVAWRDVGLELGYSCGQLDHFYEDNKLQGHKEVVYKMLLDWTQEKAERAVLGSLATTLWNLGQKYIVQELITLL